MVSQIIVSSTALTVTERLALIATHFSDLEYRPSVHFAGIISTFVMSIRFDLSHFLFFILKNPRLAMFRLSIGDIEAGTR